MESPHSTRAKNARQVKRKVKSMLIFCYQGNWSQIICPSRPTSHSHILLWRFTVTSWKCAKTSNFGDKRTGCCIITMHRLTLPLLTRNFLLKTTWLSSPHLPYLFFFRLKIKLKGSHFGTIEVIEAGSQEVLKTLGIRLPGHILKRAG
jgi:hypothetical protein